MKATTYRVVVDGGKWLAAGAEFRKVTVAGSRIANDRKYLAEHHPGEVQVAFRVGVTCVVCFGRTSRQGATASRRLSRTEGRAIGECAAAATRQRTHAGVPATRILVRDGWMARIDAVAPTIRDAF